MLVVWTIREELGPAATLWACRRPWKFEAAHHRRPLRNDDRDTKHPPQTLYNLKMSAQNSAGIQTLLDAEREAQKIVQQDRTKRVKDARSEAQKEIEEYKKEKEAEYQKFEKEHSSGNKKAEDDAKKDTDNKVKEVEDLGNKSGSKVVEQLITAVTNADPKPARAN
ncbi:V-type proton ATPase subunit G [Stagonosporopsis vannaccii]|nr:V-type proton ATPase subunit G [Stagonosporopsis vannaccii]